MEVFHDNADNLHLQMNEWQKAYPSLSKALYASILARRQGGVLPSQIQSDMAEAGRSVKAAAKEKNTKKE